MKRTKIPEYNGERLSDRDNYIKNRTTVLNEFKSYLDEVKKSKPDISGTLAGTNFQEFILAACFRCIRQHAEHLEYNTKHPIDYIDIKEEKIILKQMIKSAKSVFKDDYDRLYDHYNKELPDD